MIDPPNFISPYQWDQREERIRSVLNTLKPHIGILHLKDMLINVEGQVELPMFGRGKLTNELASAYQSFIGKNPIVAEHLGSPEDIPELLDNVACNFGA